MIHEYTEKNHRFTLDFEDGSILLKVFLPFGVMTFHDDCFEFFLNGDDTGGFICAFVYGGDNNFSFSLSSTNALAVRDAFLLESERLVF